MRPLLKNPLLEMALYLGSRGKPVFPVKGKQQPLTPHGFKNATANPKIIRGWWRWKPEANIAMPTGAASGLVVLDVDPRNGGDAALAELVAKYGPHPMTAKVESG